MRFIIIYGVFKHDTYGDGIDKSWLVDDNTGLYPSNSLQYIGDYHNPWTGKSVLNQPLQRERCGFWTLLIWVCPWWTLWVTAIFDHVFGEISPGDVNGACVTGYTQKDDVWVGSKMGNGPPIYGNAANERDDDDDDGDDDDDQPCDVRDLLRQLRNNRCCFGYL